MMVANREKTIKLRSHVTDIVCVGLTIVLDSLILSL